MPQLSLHSPLGALTLTEEDGAIVALDVGWVEERSETMLLCQARDELDRYFDGTLMRFSVRMAPVGATPYRRRIWEALGRIPYGETRTYQQIARSAGGCARSVGQASGRNPLPILIPCHRVVGSSHLGGFSMEGGLQTKRILLDLEGALPDALPLGEAA